jgi:hypothetical protein
MDIEYTVVNGQRVIVGLTVKETAEFECLDGQLPLDAKPVWPDTSNSPVEERWLELFTKYQLACQAPHRRFAARTVSAQV